MTTSPAPRFGTPDHRVSLYYFTLFTTAGVVTAYGGIWFEAMGLTERQMSLINVIPIAVVLLLNIAVGRLADRASDWKQVIVAFSLLGAVAPFGLFFAQGFWPILAFMALGTVSLMLAQPVSDAAAMRLARRTGRNFGANRAFGTLGYLVLLVLTGFLARAFGPVVFVPMLVLVGVARAGAALFLPRFRAPADLTPQHGARHLREVLRPWFVLPLLGNAIIFGSHLILNAFQSLLLSRQGIDTGTISLLIALGAGAETVMFFTFRRFAHLAPARVFILIAACVTVLRWIAFGFAPGIGPLIFLQSLHAITYAMGFIACVTFISNWTSEDIAAEAQGFFVMLQQGASILAVLAFGWLVPVYGAGAFFFSAGFAALGAGLVALSLWMKQPE